MTPVQFNRAVLAMRTYFFPNMPLAEIGDVPLTFFLKSGYMAHGSWSWLNEGKEGLDSTLVVHSNVEGNKLVIYLSIDEISHVVFDVPKPKSNIKPRVERGMKR